MISAVFFPCPTNETLLCDAEAAAAQALRDGLKLYSDGTRFALLPKPVKGWLLYAGGHDKCAA